MANRRNDSNHSIRDAQASLEARYHEVGISAVAAAMRFCNLPDAKEPARDPAPAHDDRRSADKAA